MIIFAAYRRVFCYCLFNREKNWLNWLNLLNWLNFWLNLLSQIVTIVIVVVQQQVSHATQIRQTVRSPKNRHFHDSKNEKNHDYTGNQKSFNFAEEKSLMIVFDERHLHSFY
jgi:hypothetical protein